MTATVIGPGDAGDGGEFFFWSFARCDLVEPRIHSAPLHNDGAGLGAQRRKV